MSVIDSIERHIPIVFAAFSLVSATWRSCSIETPLLTAFDIHHRVWMELQRATQDRHHAWRTPVLATSGVDGLPDARTVVLRHVDSKAGTLQIYTDSRSPKCTALLARPAAVLVFWSKRLSWQLRVRTAVSVQQAGPEVDAVWASVSQSAAAGDYLSARAPGDTLAAPVDKVHIDARSGSPSPHHLAIITAQVQEMDWLELARSGHRRAVFTTATDWEWRVP